MSDKLTEDEERVLRILYDLKDTEPSPSSERIADLAKISEARVLIALQGLAARGFVGKNGDEVSLEAVDAALKEADPNNELDTASRVLMASLMLGTGDEARIAALGLDAREVRIVGDRLRTNGVWDAGGVEIPKDGWELAILQNVASGDMTRVFDREKGEWMVSLTPAAQQRVEKMLKKKGDG